MTVTQLMRAADKADVPARVLSLAFREAVRRAKDKGADSLSGREALDDLAQELAEVAIEIDVRSSK